MRSDREGEQLRTPANTENGSRLPWLTEESYQWSVISDQWTEQVERSGTVRYQAAMSARDSRELRWYRGRMTFVLNRTEVFIFKTGVRFQV